MSFKKPFKAEPIRLGPYWLAKQRRELRNQRARLVSMIAISALLVFAIGMAATKWPALKMKLPVYYPSCAWARASGAAPIRKGQPGYRAKLDADNDGVACEPYAIRKW